MVTMIGIVGVDWLELHPIERRGGRWGMYGGTQGHWRWFLPYNTNTIPTIQTLPRYFAIPPNTLSPHYIAIPGWESVVGERDSGLGQGQLPGPAALWVIFGLEQFSEDNATPRDHWAAPDPERKERLMGILQLSIRSRIPTDKLFRTASSDRAAY